MIYELISRIVIKMPSAQRSH